MMRGSNHYRILGIGKKATPDEIRLAYLKKAKRWHPDKNKEDTTQKFQDIGEAFLVLSDSYRRNRYDRFLENRIKDEFGYGDIFKDPEFDTIKSDETRILGPGKNLFLERCLKLYEEINNSNLPITGRIIDLLIE